MLKCFLAYLGSSVKITVIYTHGHAHKEIFTLRLIGLKYGTRAMLYTGYIPFLSTFIRLLIASINFPFE